MKTLRLVRLLVSENGVTWTACCLVYSAFLYLFKCDVHTLERLMGYLERRWGLPSMCSVRVNYQIWQHWDWSRQGDEWTDSMEWKQALVDDVLLKYIEPGKAVLEIGPGSGRWTEILQRISRSLTVVDLSDRCIELCKERFAQCRNMTYFVTDGTNLEFIPSESIDFIWAFDVFVHIAPHDTETYLRQFKRVLRSGGRAVIHHAKDCGFHGAWRSRMTGGLFAEMVRRQGFLLVSQSDSVGAEKQIPVSPHHDAITVFEK